MPAGRDPTLAFPAGVCCGNECLPKVRVPALCGSRLGTLLSPQDSPWMLHRSCWGSWWGRRSPTACRRWPSHEYALVFQDHHTSLSSHRIQGHVQ